MTTTATTTDQTITLPTRHPKWCIVDSHQGLLDDLDADEQFDETEVDRVRTHWAGVSEHLLFALNRKNLQCVRDAGGYWNITLEQQPNINDIEGGGGQPFISLNTRDLGLAAAMCTLTLTSGETRVLAAQLTAAADKIDLS